jgi:hypothetical protein
MSSTIRAIAKTLIVLILVFFLYSSVITFIQKATGEHWLLGAAMTLFYGSAI